MAREIFISQASVDQWLNQILQVQFPDQEEIRRNADLVKQPIIEAKIYSLAA